MDKDYLELKKWLDDTSDVPLETMSGFFDERIDMYEDHMSRWNDYYKWMADLIPDSSEYLLDIGCGSGLELDYIFKRFPLLQVEGVDLSKEMLRKLKEKHHDKNLKIIYDDYFKYEMGEEKYDTIISFQTLHHYTFKKKEELFRKVHKALKNGGVYLECDYIASSQAIEDLSFKECKRRRERDNINDDVYVHFDTPLTIEHEIQCLKNSGFANVELVGFLGEDNHTAMIRAKK